MKSFFDSSIYRINHPLFVRVDAENFEAVKRKLLNMSRNKEEKINKAFFNEIQMCMTGMTGSAWKVACIRGRWTFESDFQKIKSLIGDPESIKIGNPPIEESEALAEVARAVEDEKEEWLAMETVRHFYAQAINDRDYLREDGNGSPSNIMQAQLNMIRNKSLKEMSDKLNSIANSLSVIASKM